MTKKWRPYKNASAKYILPVIVAAIGAYASSQDVNSVMTSIISAGALAHLYRTWKDEKKDVEHQKMLNSAIASTIKGNENINYFNDENNRNKIVTALSTSHLVVEKTSIQKHELYASWSYSDKLLNTTDLEVFIACVMMAALKAKEAVPKVNLKLSYQRENGLDTCKLLTKAFTSAEEIHLFFKEFAYYINFMLDNDNIQKDLKFKILYINEPMDEKELLITGPGEWLLKDGYILDVTKNIENNNKFEVALFDIDTGEQGFKQSTLNL